MPTTFTVRERQLITRVLAGESNREIAQKLGLKEQTIRNRLTTIYRKCQVTSRVQLVLHISRNRLGHLFNS